MSAVKNELRAGAQPELFGGAAEPFWAWFRRDIGRVVDLDQSASFRTMALAVLKNEGLWALFTYRLGRWLKTRDASARGVLRQWGMAVLWAVYACLSVWVSLVVDIQLCVDAEIGPGLYVGHLKSIHIGAGVKVGQDCNIGQMCWVSAAGPGFAAGAPVIGDRVYIGVGAKILGPIRVGSDVAIGANAVLVEDVPDSAVVAGNPARVVSMKGSADFISVKTRDKVPAMAAAVKSAPRAEA